MNADLRALREQEMMERELVQERMSKFWKPEPAKRAEMVEFLIIDLNDETDLQDLFFDLCAQDIDDAKSFNEAAKKLVIRAQAEIYRYAQNDKLPITILTNEPEDARAMARGQI